MLVVWTSPSAPGHTDATASRAPCPHGATVCVWSAIDQSLWHRGCCPIVIALKSPGVVTT